MCKFDKWKKASKSEVETAMLIPGEYRVINGEYYIPDVPFFLDGYICQCGLNVESYNLEGENYGRSTNRI